MSKNNSKSWSKLMLELKQALPSATKEQINTDLLEEVFRDDARRQLEEKKAEATANR